MPDMSRKLVVILPALNEERTIRGVIEGIPRDIEGVSQVGVVVVDDGSTDSTAQIALRCGADVVSHGENRGVGAAMATGIGRALELGADIMVNMDADGQFNPADVVTLIGPLLAGKADFVTASRFARKEFVPTMPLLKKWGNVQMSKIVNFATGKTHLTDVSCGFRAYSRIAALHLNLCGAFTYTHESIIGLANKGLRIVEVPLRVRGERQHGQSRVARSLFRYGINALLIIIRAFCYTRPLTFFGTIGSVVTLLGVVQGLVVFAWWLFTGGTSPIKSLLIGSSLFLTVGFLILVLALLADMLHRQIGVSEDLLFEMKQRKFKGPSGAQRENEEGP